MLRLNLPTLLDRNVSCCKHNPHQLQHICSQYHQISMMVVEADFHSYPNRRWSGMRGSIVWGETQSKLKHDYDYDVPKWLLKISAPPMEGINRGTRTIWQSTFVMMAFISRWMPLLLSDPSNKECTPWSRNVALNRDDSVAVIGFDSPRMFQSIFFSNLVTDNHVRNVESHLHQRKYIMSHNLWLG